MTLSTTRGTLITFYSWKGGVGRTMALANIGVQLARQGRSVLMVDWDLEAPGLARYFAESGDLTKPNVGGGITAAPDDSGLMGLLHDAGREEYRPPERRDWESRLRRITVPSLPSSFRVLNPPTPGKLDLLPSGHGGAEYPARVSGFSWDRFFAERRGGEWLEDLRGQWATAYDFVLIDSRTGLTDSGGVCTIVMPDVLALVFTANHQSLEDGLAIVEAAQRNRASYAYDRAPLAVVPLLSRWCGDDEVDIGEHWMERLNGELRPLVSAWLPLGFEPRQFLEKTRVTHVARFSFGEPLPVLTHSLTDANLPGLAYDTLARLLASRLADVGKIIDPAYEPPPFTAGYGEQDELRLLALVQDGTALYQEIARLSKVHGADSAELADFLNDAGLALRRLARNAEAEPLYRRSLAICERLHGADHAETAIRLNNLAALLQATNRRDEAEPLMHRALAIDEQSFGPDHPNVAIRLNNLAQLLADTNRQAEAEPLMRRALAIDEQSFGPDHPNVAIDLNNLAQLLADTNRLAEAEPLMRRALAIDEQGFGPDHPNVARDLNNLALLLQDTNRLDEAEPLMRRALAIILDFARRNGHIHPDQSLYSANYSALLRDLGKTEAEIQAALDGLGASQDG
jgi:tetratricopeptide (TPR) repeat protein